MDQLRDYLIRTCQLPVALQVLLINSSYAHRRGGTAPPLMLPFKTEISTTGVATTYWDQGRSAAIHSAADKYKESLLSKNAAGNYADLMDKVSSEEAQSQGAKSVAAAARQYAQNVNKKGILVEQKAAHYLLLAQEFWKMAQEKARPENPESLLVEADAREYFEVCKKWAVLFFNNGKDTPEYDQALDDMGRAYSRLVEHYISESDEASEPEVNHCEVKVNSSAEADFKRKLQAVKKIVPSIPPAKDNVKSFVDNTLKKFRFEIHELLEGGVEQYTSVPEKEGGRRIIVKEIKEGAYDGPRTADFTERLSIYREVGQRECELRVPDLVKQTQCKKEIENRFLIAEDQIKKRACLDIDALQANLYEKKKSFFKRIKDRILGKQDPFKGPYNWALRIIQNYLFEISNTLKDFTNNKCHPNDLFKLEPQFVSEKLVPAGGKPSENQIRPNLANLYEIGTEVEGSTRLSKYLSMQRGFSTQDTTRSSALRTEGGLSNAVETSFHTVKSEIANGKEEFTTVPKFSAYRIAVSVPISIKQEVKRLAEGTLNFRRVLEQAVMDQCDAAASKGGFPDHCPKEINLSTAMLVTPFLLTKPFDKNINEYQQLKEAY